MTRREKQWRRSLVVGTAVITVFAAAVVFSVNATGGLPGTTEMTVKTAFNDVGTLREDDDVRVGGVRVGRVSEVSYEDGRAIAELELTEIDTVYRNAEARTASVGARSALGAKYVELNPGTPDAGKIQPGQVLSATETGGARDVTELLEVLDEPTRDSLGSFLRETGTGFSEHERNISDAIEGLPEALPDLATVSRSLAVDDGADVTRLLSDLDTLAGRFEGRQDQIADLAGQLGTTLRAVTVDGGEPLRRSIAQAPQTLRDVRHALGALDEPLAHTESAMTELRPGGEALGQALPDLRGVLREAPQPLDRLPAVSDEAVPAVDELTEVMADARPVAPQVTRALGEATDPLAVLAPYSSEIADFFTHLKRALDNSDESGNWLSLVYVPSGESAATGMLPGSDPTVARNPYPGPGEAGNDRKSGLIEPKGDGS
ncbi:phospholipid/cholesterol/gamma-HCH transport system substrate-binding protein [Haloechinothrix alba]|uniref:Phospholipid/cholesterol/gamma-HCH transport system substrate-binding protein n=1 Tax=Haloechinothrix alba TaxID=664784 RepID=A0A238ZFE4_9PSEU|nr:MlaD family protein [Haloechinothrix alba]SNR82245.1 phospholipid/cholesterol/gamma-HCH transport system substrate-binding protein [Haloechinothrix alba]